MAQDGAMPQKSDFDFDPFINCPFDNSELELVEEADGFKREQFVILNKLGTELQGTIYAIGKNAKYLDGEKFTAVIIEVGTEHHLATSKEIKALS